MAREARLMENFAARFWADENGAETPEWVLITAILVVIAIAVYQGPVAGTLTGLAGSISSQFTAATQSWANHGAAVSTEAKSDSTGREVASTAKRNPGSKAYPNR